MIDVMTGIIFFGVPLSLGLLGYGAVRLHEMQAPPVPAAPLMPQAPQLNTTPWSETFLSGTLLRNREQEDLATAVAELRRETYRRVDKAALTPLVETLAPLAETLDDLSSVLHKLGDVQGSIMAANESLEIFTLLGPKFSQKAIDVQSGILRRLGIGQGLEQDHPQEDHAGDGRGGPTGCNYFQGNRRFGAGRYVSTPNAVVRAKLA